MTADEPTSTRPPAAGVPDWVREHYRKVDAADLDGYSADFDPGIELRFASQPPIRGIAAAREALAKGHARHAMSHVIVGCWEHGDTTILEFDVTYTFPDGHRSQVPSVAIVHRGESGLLDSLRVYVERPH